MAWIVAAALVIFVGGMLIVASEASTAGREHTAQHRAVADRR
jgi:hypothetical protein